MCVCVWSMVQDVKLLHSVQMKNQVNNGLNSKLQKVKDHLTMQQKVLENRKKEIEKLRGWDNNLDQKTDRTAPLTKPISADAARLMPTPTPSKRNTPSSSRKRHANIIEAKSRQFVEEEGHTFKQQALQGGTGEGVWSQGEGTDGAGEPPILPSPHTSGVSVPAPKPKWNREEGGVASSTAGRSKKERRVRFDAEAIILNAALEGELDLLKGCIEKVVCIISCNESWVYFISLSLVGVATATTRVPHVCTMPCARGTLRLCHT